MIDDPERRRPFYPGGPLMPSRAELRAQAEIAVARSKAAAEMRAEAKEKAEKAKQPNLDHVPVAWRPYDEFAQAKERWNARQELEAKLLKQLDDEILLQEAAARKLRDLKRSLTKARAIIKETPPFPTKRRT
jgi:hypothetical protein